MKKIVCALLALGFVLLGFSAMLTNAEWEGKSWSYKWEASFADLMREMEEAMEQADGDTYGSSYDISNISASGGIVQMVTIKYDGVEDGNHKFSYKSGAYGKGKFGMTISSTFENMTRVMKMKCYLDEIDGKASGMLEVVDAGTYYGVESQTINSLGSMEMRASIDISGNIPGGGMQGTSGIDMTVNWNLGLDITYSPALPWIPKRVPINEEEWVTASYYGEITGHIKMVPKGMLAEMGDITPVDLPISETLSDSESIFASLISHSTKVTKPSPVLCAGEVGGEVAYSKAQQDTYYSPSLLSCIERSTIGYFDTTEKFYTALELGSAAMPSPGTTFTPSPTNLTITSTPTTENEVNSFIANREAYFNALSFESIGAEPGVAVAKDNWLWWIITIVGVIAAVIIVVVCLWARARKRRAYPLPPTAPPSIPSPPPQPPRGEKPQPRTIKCPACGSVGSVASSFRGKLRCPNCNSMFEV